MIAIDIDMGGRGVGWRGLIGGLKKKEATLIDPDMGEGEN